MRRVPTRAAAHTLYTTSPRTQVKQCDTEVQTSLRKERPPGPPHPQTDCEHLQFERAQYPGAGKSSAHPWASAFLVQLLGAHFLNPRQHIYQLKYYGSAIVFSPARVLSILLAPRMTLDRGWDGGWEATVTTMGRVPQMRQCFTLSLRTMPLKPA